MKSEQGTDATRRQESCEQDNRVTRWLVLPDGRVLAHNLTAAIAEILQLLDPNDQPLLERGRLLQGAMPSTSSTPTTPVSVTP
jgi:hypothetical protein